MSLNFRRHLFVWLRFALSSNDPPSLVLLRAFVHETLGADGRSKLAASIRTGSGTHVKVRCGCYCCLSQLKLFRVAKNYGLLEAKELTSLSNTLQLVRPSTNAPRPTKRQNSDHHDPSIEKNSQSMAAADSMTMMFAAPPPPAWSRQQHVARVPAMKSGSWGGHSVQDPSFLAANCSSNNKCYAQTC